MHAEMHDIADSGVTSVLYGSAVNSLSERSLRRVKSCPKVLSSRASNFGSNRTCPENQFRLRESEERVELLPFLFSCEAAG